MSRKILIIEDEKEMAQLMSWGLAQSNFESRLAYDGLEGLKAIKEEEPDLILTDVVMPRMDGYTLCRRLQEDGTLARIPVIVLTAFADRAEDFRGIQIREFLPKPFDRQMLVDVIEKALGTTPTPPKGPFKTKTVLLQSNKLEPGVELALKQFKDIGCSAEVEIFSNGEKFVEKVLRVQPTVLILDASKPGTPQLIRSLHSYVLLKDMTILFYTKIEKEESKAVSWWLRHRAQPKKNDALEETKKLCLEAGAAKHLESLDRETFLSILMEYCRA